MAVSLRANFDANQIRQYLLQQQERIEAAVLSALQRVGETFITDARNTDTYKDRTGNLRSSIGYVVLKNGEQIGSSFTSSDDVASVGETVTIGEDVSKTVIDEIAADYPTGFVLIVVAGMDYAAAVEAKGYDVLTASSHKAETDLRVALSKIQNKL